MAILRLKKMTKPYFHIKKKQKQIIKKYVILKCKEFLLTESALHSGGIQRGKKNNHYPVM